MWQKLATLYNFTIIYARNLALLSTEMIAEKKMLPVREPGLNSTTTQCEATQEVENVWVSEYNDGCSTASTAEMLCQGQLELKSSKGKLSNITAQYQENQLFCLSILHLKVSFPYPITVRFPPIYFLCISNFITKNNVISFISR